MATTLYFRVASELERADRAAEVDFDIDTLEYTTRADPAGLLAGRETWLKDSLRGGYGHLIAARVRRRKLAEDAYREVDWSNYKRGELISFHEAHPREFDLVVVLDRQRYWVRDQYCVTPRCDCQEAVFEVLPVGERCGEQIRADLKQERIAGFVSERARRVWASVIDEYGWPAPRERRAKMRKLARYIAPQMQAYEAPTRAPVRPGRNDPCSCGSGKKYKKCCAATEAAR